MEIMRALDRELANWKKKILSTRTRIEETLRGVQRQHRAEIKRLESDAGMTLSELPPQQREIFRAK